MKERGKITMMKIFKQLILIMAFVVGISVTVSAQKPDDPKKTPPKPVKPLVPITPKNDDKPKNDKKDDKGPKKPEIAFIGSENKIEIIYL